MVLKIIQNMTRAVVWTIIAITGTTTARAETALGLLDFQGGRFAEAYGEWRQAAAAGDARGALFVGVLYDTGLGVTQNSEQAQEWYRRAAESGSAVGAFNVAVMYDGGQTGGTQNLPEAAIWYARAAAKGFARAEYNLALLYEAGTGVPRNRNRATQLYTSAAAHGISAARAHLVALGQPFAATPRRVEDTSMRDFQQAEQILLTRGPAEINRAAKFFRRAADLHNPLAEYDLGYCYEHGMGVPQDQIEAYELYRRAVTHAVDDSLRSLASASVRNLQGQLNQAQLHHSTPPR